VTEVLAFASLELLLCMHVCI